jgi:hypothetical protein
MTRRKFFGWIGKAAAAAWLLTAVKANPKVEMVTFEPANLRNDQMVHFIPGEMIWVEGNDIYFFIAPGNPGHNSLIHESLTVTRA